jgi:hypothetical protein
MADASINVDQIGVVTAETITEQGVSAVVALKSVVNQTYLMMLEPAHIGIGLLPSDWTSDG